MGRCRHQRERRGWGGKLKAAAALFPKVTLCSKSMFAFFILELANVGVPTSSPVYIFDVRTHKDEPGKKKKL